MRLRSGYEIIQGFKPLVQVEIDRTNKEEEEKTRQRQDEINLKKRIDEAVRTREAIHDGLVSPQPCLPDTLPPELVVRILKIMTSADYVGLAPTQERGRGVIRSVAKVEDIAVSTIYPSQEMMKLTSGELGKRSQSVA
ncbi:hypothetical protein E4T42_09033 [Aureobasidium subglaciale]|nr:hypothetical protein E4T42_09033 [Aureobasidium subglaciale]